MEEEAVVVPLLGRDQAAVVEAVPSFHRAEVDAGAAACSSDSGPTTEVLGAHEGAYAHVPHAEAEGVVPELVDIRNDDLEADVGDDVDDMQLQLDHEDAFLWGLDMAC